MQRGMFYSGRVKMKRGMGNNFADLVQDFCVLRKHETLGLREKAKHSVI